MYTTYAMLVLLPALAWVICSDLLYRRIHNTLVLILLALWLLLPLAALFGLGPFAALAGNGLLYQVLRALCGASIVLLVGFVLFSLGRVGAGDVKLMAVMCLWLSGLGLMSFLIVTALAGGLLALGLPLLTMLEGFCAQAWMKFGQRHPRLAIPTPMVLTEDCPQGIPYGLAIAAGAFYTLLFPIHS
ncbi:A24 family peptidase [Stutzerimonas kirkiae]|uniref:A24 family peptidase n=1 Tax=Stutzerimonas kirkiae TaxID=2211392 RepID=UPI001038440C|nr:prepilin peptidase [Stutzerimonas kirkiae]TBV09167.1 peptidase A24 [Stutzerimonas kirkiae]